MTTPEVVTDSQAASEPAGSQQRMGMPPWPKIGDRCTYGETGREGDVIGIENGRVKVDWGLYVTTHPINELEPLQW